MAVAAGADAIGMIRVPEAGRYVELDEVRNIVHALPAFVTPVLVYRDPTAHEMENDLPRLHPAYPVIQLNGHESPDWITNYPRLPFIKAIRMDADAAGVLKAYRDARMPNLLGVVLESPGQVGGSGVGNDWQLVKRLLAEGAFEGLPIIAAGGLNPENVGGLVREIRPFGVDVSSGVETVKRQKDAGRIRAFVEAVRGADQTA